MRRITVLPYNPDISYVRLQNFRNYDLWEQPISAKHIIVTGPNGSGKTNLLEALSFFSPGRGLRRAKLGDVTTVYRPESSAWSCSITVGETVLGTGLSFTQTGMERRLIKADGEQIPAQNLSEHLSVSWLTPQMGGLFWGSSSDRRKFLDHLALGIDPEHAARLKRYEHVMRERLTLLKEGRMDPLWLGQLEEKMAELGVAISASRVQLVVALNRHQEQEKEYPFPKFFAKVRGKIDQNLEQEPALACEAFYAEQLKDNRQLDGQTGRTTFGAHRSDLDVLHVPKQCQAAFCSTGEQKILLTGIMIAYVRYQQAVRSQTGARPAILLLDDVVAHLDYQHRVVLFHEIKRLSLQIWMTGADEMDFDTGFGTIFSEDVQRIRLTKNKGM